MARIQPVLTPSDLALVGQMAELTGSKRTDVIRSLLDRVQRRRIPASQLQ